MLFIYLFPCDFIRIHAIFLQIFVTFQQVICLCIS
uniref:Uncharacterized protein n=1 Tax=Arundo donax TaxID=35708 RepID=A0A0A8XRM4_ARUDO